MITMRKILLFCLLTIYLIACTTKEEINYQYPVFPQKYQIETTILNDSTIYDHASQLLLYDSILIVAGSDKENNVLLFDCNGKYLTAFARRGNGPGELTYPKKHSIDQATGTLYIHEYNKQAMIKYFINNIITGENPMFNEEKLSGTIVNAADIFFLKDSFYLATGRDYRLLIRTASTVMTSTNQVTQLNGFESDQNLYNYFSTYSCHALNPSKTKFISASMYGGVMEIFSIETDKIYLEKSLCFFPPVLKSYGYPVRENEDTIWGFTCLATTDEYIYAGVFGIKNPTEMPSTIWKFDWDGNPVCSYKTTYPVESFTIDESTETIYASVYKDGEQVIAKIDLKEATLVTD